MIVLSDEFYSEITSHPIPTDLEAIRVLAGAPAVLDLFKCGCLIAAILPEPKNKFRSSVSMV